MAVCAPLPPVVSSAVAPPKAVRFAHFAPGLGLDANARPSLDIMRVNSSDAPLVTYIPISPRSEARSRSPSPTWGLFGSATPREYDAEKATASYFDAMSAGSSGSRGRMSPRMWTRRLAVAAVALTVVVGLQAGARAFPCVIVACL